MRHAFPLLVLALVACSPIDDPERVVWAPETEPVPDTAAVEAPLRPDGCEDVRVERWHYLYDGGRMVGAEGADRSERWSYDAHGRVDECEAEHADGLRLKISIRRDEAGALVERRVESSDGVSDARTVVVERTPERVVVDFDGPVLLYPHHPATAPEVPKDVRADLEETGIRDEAMLAELVRRVEAGEAYDDFDPFRVREIRSLDEAGRVVRVAWDLGRDGELDLVEEVVHQPTPDGRREVAALDRSADGTFERVATRTFDGADRLVMEAIDEDGDGWADRTTSWTFDAEGRVIETTEETPAGRSAVRFERMPDLVVELRDTDGDGADDHVTELHLRPEDGQRVLKQEDYDGDGQVDWQRRYIHRPDGKRIIAERDMNVDGVPDQRWDGLYDEEGRLTWEVFTEPGSARCGGVRPE